MAFRGVLGFGFALCFFGGCSSDASSAGAPSPVHAPDNFDLDVCAHIVESGSLSFSGECDTCCQNAGFSDSSGINDDKCTCANLPAGEGKTICTSQTASADACSGCCTGAHYSVYVWLGDTSCECAAKTDETVCAGSASDSALCAHCCLDQGFLGFGYIGIGTPSCSCSGK